MAGKWSSSGKLASGKRANPKIAENYQCKVPGFFD